MKQGYKKRFDLTKEVSERLAYLQEIKQISESMLEKMPPGNLLVSPGSSDKTFRYYVRQQTKEKCGKYLDRSKKTEKELYANKKYYQQLLKNVNSEIKELSKIQKLSLVDSVIQSYAALHPGVKILINPLNIDDDSYVQQWLQQPYTGLEFDESDQTKYYSEKGERMRSKSELLIANALTLKGIPYKYECPVRRKNGEVLYPDFTILDIRQRRVVYWEHLGKMGDMSYVSKNIWKLDEYKKNGIYLGDNLFVTYESGFSALGTDEIKHTIACIFGV